MKIIGSKDCGNSPKNLFVQDMAVAFEAGRLDPVTVTEDFTLHVGDRSETTTTEAQLPWLDTQSPPIEIQVLHAIAHGRTGAANGMSIFEDGSKRSFSYVFEFKNTTAKCVAVVYRYS